MAIKPKAPAVLAFDTSCERFSAALFYKGLRKEAERRLDLRHSEEMFILMGRFLRSNSCPWSKIGIIAVGLGPGSFTGLRVGVTAAKTMAYATGAKLCGFSSLEIIARAFLGKGTVGVAMDARRGNVYSALYREGKVLKPPALMTQEAFQAEKEPGILYVGTAAGVAKEALPHARNMIRMALERLEEGVFQDPFALVPQYLYGRECNVTKPKERTHGKRGKETASAV